MKYSFILMSQSSVVAWTDHKELKFITPSSLKALLCACSVLAEHYSTS